MINVIQLITPAKMLRETAMNIGQFRRLRADYFGFIRAAATAVLRLECRSEVVIVALANLAVALETECDRPEVERAERYVAECWAEFAPPTGVIYKVAL